MAEWHEKKCLAVVGFYEPVPGLNRGGETVVVFEKGDIKEYIAPIYDDTMGLSLKNAIDYFLGNLDNPCAVDMAIEILVKIDPGVSHQALEEADVPLEILVIATPSAIGDNYMV